MLPHKLLVKPESMILVQEPNILIEDLQSLRDDDHLLITTKQLFESLNSKLQIASKIACQQ